MRFGFCIAGIFWMMSSFAMTAKAEIYDLEKCIQTALEKNYGVVSAKNAYDAARWNVWSGYGQILPRISISVDRNRSWFPMTQSTYYINGIPFTSSRGGANVNYGGDLNIGQSYAGLGIGLYAAIKQRHAQKNYYFYGYVEAKRNLILKVKEAYYNVVKTRMLVDVAKDAVKRGEEQLKVAQSRYELGAASFSDVLKARVLRSNARVELVTAENNHNLAKANLNYVLGLDVGQDIEITEDLHEPELNITYDGALAEALGNNAVLLQTKHDLEISKMDLLNARTRFLPSLSFNLRYSNAADKFDDLMELRGSNSSSGFGIALSYSIFNNFSDMSGWIAQRKLVNTQKRGVVDKENSIALEVKQAFLNVQQGKEKLALTRESVAAAQEDLNIVREKYNLGAATILEVLDAEVSFKQAQIGQVQALFDYNLAVSNLEKTMGR